MPCNAKHRNRNPAGNARHLQWMEEEGYPTIQVEAAYEAEEIAPNKRFLLVCEGENTEYYYFDSFRLTTTATIDIDGGYGGGKVNLVEKAKKIRDENEEYKDHEVWCVFDYDINPEIGEQSKDFNEAVKKAEAYGFKVAFSNDCFELWLILHYKLISGQHHRDEYYRMLRKEWSDLPGNYRDHGKDEKFCRSIYKRLEEQQEKAMRHATHLHEQALKTGCPPADMNPCTTVHLLVQELNKYLKK